MGDEPDLDPAINKDFFENNILQLDPTLLTESGIKCFERFFKAVNVKEGKLKPKRRSLITEDADLIGKLKKSEQWKKIQKPFAQCLSFGTQFFSKQQVVFVLKTDLQKVAICYENF